jgi:hypothetical protein
MTNICDRCEHEERCQRDLSNCKFPDGRMQVSRVSKPSAMPPKNEWQLVDEIGRALTQAIKNCETVQGFISINSATVKAWITTDLIETKHLLNQLKSLMVDKVKE